MGACGCQLAWRGDGCADLHFGPPIEPGVHATYHRLDLHKHAKVCAERVFGRLFIREFLLIHQQAIAPLYSIAALINVGVALDKIVFERFVDEVNFDLQIGNSSMIGYVYYAPRVDASARQQWQQDNHVDVTQFPYDRQPTDKLELNPRTPEQAYFPLQFIYPNVFSPFVGIDVASDYERYRGISGAIANNSPRTTAFLDKYRYNVTGVGTIIPIYNRNATVTDPSTWPVLKDPSQSRSLPSVSVPDSFRGLVVGIFRIDLAFKLAELHNTLGFVSVSVSDILTGSSVYQSAQIDAKYFGRGTSTQSGLLEDLPTWNVDCIPTQHAADVLDNWVPMILLITCIIIMFLLSVLMALFCQHYVKYRRKATTRTAELKMTQKRMHAILSSMKDMFISFDQSYHIIQANPAALDTLDYDKPDLIGKCVFNVFVKGFEVDAATVIHDTAESHQNQLLNCCGQQWKSSISSDPSQVHVSNSDTPPSWLENIYEVTVKCSDGREFEAEVKFSQVQLKECIIYVALFRDVTERRQMTQALADSKAKAEHALFSKNNLLAWICHEMRNPLHTVLGMSELLLMDPDTQLNGTQLDCAKSIQSSAELMESIANDVLDMSKIEAGMLKIQQIAFDLTDLLDDVKRSNALFSKPKNITWDVKMTPRDRDILKAIIGDPTRLRQVLVNLISNALKFTSEGFVILTVTCSKLTADLVNVTFNIEDSGIGIKQDDLVKLFHTYVQVTHTTKQQYKGTGLGLFIVKSLVSQMGGTVYVTSEFGKGSIFVVDIPIRRDASVALSEAWASSVVVTEFTHQEESTFLKQSTMTFSNPSLPTAVATHKFPSQIRILVIERNKNHQKLFISILRRFNYYVVAADTFAQCTHSALHDHYDVIIIEQEMAKTILESLQRWWSRYHTTAPLIVATCEPCGLPGVDEYFPKPFSFSKLVQIISLDIEQHTSGMMTKSFSATSLSRSTLFGCAKTAELKENNGSSLSLADMVKDVEVNETHVVVEEPTALRVLFAEDDPINRRLGIAMLKKGGFEVESVVNGQLAVESYQKSPDAYDIYLLDMNMPLMGGIEAGTLLRELGWKGALVSLTANATIEDRLKCEQAGFNAHLTKPVKMQTLHQTLLDAYASTLLVDQELDMTIK